MMNWRRKWLDSSIQMLLNDDDDWCARENTHTNECESPVVQPKSQRIEMTGRENVKLYPPDSWCWSILWTECAQRCCNGQTLPLGGDTWILQHPESSRESNYWQFLKSQDKLTINRCMCICMWLNNAIICFARNHFNILIQICSIQFFWTTRISIERQ